MAQEKKQPLLIIVGPTASGKTRLGVAMAKALSGEVISADSMQMYRRMNIATAKPTAEEMEGVPHHLMDFLEPDQSFSVAEYAQQARDCIAQVAARGHLPIMVGGTGLYVNTVADNITFSEAPSDEAYRESLRKLAEEQGVLAVYSQLQQLDPESAAAIHPNNLGRVIRALEVYHTTGITMTEQRRRSRLVPSPYRLSMIGLCCRDRQKLYDRIDRRVDEMVRQGLLEEARQVLAEGLSATAAQAIGYKELKGYFAGEESLEAALERVRQESRRYAKRQLTWFRRDQRIHWLETDVLGDFEHILARALELAVEDGVTGGEDRE
ncbi:tRNA (adenosine(37)-N6)-dimethylallyltransferase MiaA [Angelakisella massiliensis]|mgnify:FL=1|uniref:tRNA (adenosine(37)-N6)-dimethylallyltransferase MiaA n=1 Tax=Angelakisella massiliensis TaxID=1871018 RepID=UPI0008F8E16C|nr:tRNA (adenosine(37)-N6)-dimethylallyltransferase MiaA [Angelakisella massiliensis]